MRKIFYRFSIVNANVPYKSVGTKLYLIFIYFIVDSLKESCPSEEAVSQEALQKSREVSEELIEPAYPCHENQTTFLATLHQPQRSGGCGQNMLSFW